MKERVAIFLESEKSSGGAYHELIYMIEKIEKLNNNKLEIIIICTSPDLQLNLEKKEFETYYFSMNSFERYICFLRNYGSFARRIKKYFFFNNKFENFLKKIKVDLVYFTGPSQYSLYLEDTDFIITVPDVSHRDNIEFPEWAKSSEFHRRDEILSRSTIKAIAVITNAKIIKDKISSFYSVSKERIYVINHQPSLAISKFKEEDKTHLGSFKKKYKLPEKYIFYPANYWPHKNHKCVIDAIKILKSDHDINLSAVFCGSDKGYLKRIKNYVAEKKQNENIIFLDFVDDEHLPYLYLNSLALVMPTLSGPTNIPPWEAFKMNIPVLYSNIDNIKEVYRDAVYYINPLDPKDVAIGIKTLIQNKNLNNELTNKGKKLLDSVDVDKELEQFFTIIKKHKKIKKTWELEN